jgi:flagellar hook assembly protein FlgD
VVRLDRAATVNLSIYDVRGRLVRTLVDGPLSATEHRLAWDGRDGTGNPVASGVYFCRLTSRSFVGSRKLVVVR